MELITGNGTAKPARGGGGTISGGPTVQPTRDCVPVILTVGADARVEICLWSDDRLDLGRGVSTSTTSTDYLPYP